MGLLVPIREDQRPRSRSVRKLAEEKRNYVLCGDSRPSIIHDGTPGSIQWVPGGMRVPAAPRAAVCGNRAASIEEGFGVMVMKVKNNSGFTLIESVVVTSTKRHGSLPLKSMSSLKSAREKAFLTAGSIKGSNF